MRIVAVVRYCLSRAERQVRPIYTKHEYLRTFLARSCGYSEHFRPKANLVSGFDAAMVWKDRAWYSLAKIRLLEAISALFTSRYEGQFLSLFSISPKCTINWDLKRSVLACLKRGKDNALAAILSTIFSLSYWQIICLWVQLKCFAIIIPFEWHYSRWPGWH